MVRCRAAGGVAHPQTNLPTHDPEIHKLRFAGRCLPQRLHPELRAVKHVPAEGLQDRSIPDNNRYAPPGEPHQGLQNEFSADTGGVPHGDRYAFQILTSIYEEDLSLEIYVLYLFSDSIIKSFCLTLSLTDSKEADEPFF